jgi:hypothetical protein
MAFLSFHRATDKSVSFEKSVSFSDDPPDMLSSPKQHTPQLSGKKHTNQSRELGISPYI